MYRTKVLLEVLHVYIYTNAFLKARTCGNPVILRVLIFIFWSYNTVIIPSTSQDSLPMGNIHKKVF